MRSVLGFTVFAAALVALAWWMAGLPGTVSATFGNTAVSTSTPIALLLLILLFVVLYALVRLVAWIQRSPRRLRERGERRQRSRGDMAITRTLVALAAGNGAAALREAERSRRMLGATPLTMLLTAQSQRQAGQEAAAAGSFRQLAGRKDAAFLGLRGLLRQAIVREDWVAADTLAKEAEAALPGAAWLREERKMLALRTGQWADALRLSGPEGRASLALAAAGTATEPAAALRLAKQAWTSDPSLIPAAVAYSSRLRAVGKGRAANDVLRRSWATAPHPEVAQEYLRGIGDAETRLNVARGLAKQNASHPESNLLLAQASLDAGVLPDARRYAEAAQAGGLNQRRVWALLADIADQEDNANGVQDALRRGASADPDPGWRCEACGAGHADWQPVCDACGTLGKIVWGEGGRARPVALLAQSREDGFTSP